MACVAGETDGKRKRSVVFQFASRKAFVMKTALGKGYQQGQVLTSSLSFRTVLSNNFAKLNFCFMVVLQRR
jgi:hypothetical protein